MNTNQKQSVYKNKGVKNSPTNSGKQTAYRTGDKTQPKSNRQPVYRNKA